MEITRSSTVRAPKECDNADPVLKLQVSPCPSIKYQHQRSTSQPMPLKKLDGVVASFTNQPPASSDLHRPRPVRHPPSPTTANESGDNLMDLSSLALACSRNGLPSTPTPSSACHPFNGTSSPLKKSAPCGPHSSTGQHLHQYGPARSLVSHGLSIGTSSAADSSRCQDSSSQNHKKSRPNKQVTFQTEARLIGNESVTLPVVFESDREDGGQTDGTKEPQPLEMPGFVNIPCSRRGFCLELDSANDLPEVGKLNESCGSSSEQTTTDEVDHHHVVKRVMSPDGGYDWQPSYVNLEDTEIAPVLLASSRPADDSSDFWKPRSVASGGRQQQQLGEPLQPVYDAPNNNNNKTIDVDNPLLLEFPGFRYAMMQLPGNNALMERRSISNGSSGSDTQVNYTSRYFIHKNRETDNSQDNKRGGPATVSYIYYSPVCTYDIKANKIRPSDLSEDCVLLCSRPSITNTHKGGWGGRFRPLSTHLFAIRIVAFFLFFFGNLWAPFGSFF